MLRKSVTRARILGRELDLHAILADFAVLNIDVERGNESCFFSSTGRPAAGALQAGEQLLAPHRLTM